MRPLSHISKRIKNKAPLRSGFTLIETLLAITIFSFIAAGLAVSFYSGMGLWSRAAASDSRRNDVILGFESVSGEIRQGIEMPPIGYEGGPKGFSFPAVSGNTIVKIQYSFDDARKMLVRRESRLQDIINKKSDVIEKDFLALAEFSAQYLKIGSETGTYEWKDGWSKDEGIFNAVRFKGRVKDDEFQKTVFVPVS